MAVDSFRRALDEGTSSPIVARLFFGLLQLRDTSKMAVQTPLDSAHFSHTFDARHRPIFEACLATRDAAREVLRLSYTHQQDVATGRVIAFDPPGYQVLSTIDKELSQAIAKLLDQAVIACKSTLQRMLDEVLQLDIGFLYMKDPAFEEGLASLQRDGVTDLQAYLVAVRATWLSALLSLRNKHEHEGWTLPRCDYAMPTPGHVTLRLPHIDAAPVDQWAQKTANQVLRFVEDMIVFGLARRAPHPLYIVEVPPQHRDPRNVLRFRLAAKGFHNNTQWTIAYAEEDAFI